MKRYRLAVLALNIVWSTGIIRWLLGLPPL
jgi:hypothetical protein